MSFLDDMAASIFEAFTDDFRDATLSLPGAETSDGRGGFTTASPTPYACKALVVDYDDYRRLTLGIPATDRLVIVLAASLTTGIVPLVGASITAPDPRAGNVQTLFGIIAVSGDPAAATYELQAR